MRVAFTGTLKGLTPGQAARLRTRLLELSPTMFVHGACIGADDDADLIAATHGIPREVFPSDDPDRSVSPTTLYARGNVTIHPKLPALKRNLLIIKDADVLLACPRSPVERLRSGTWMTVRHGRKSLGEDKVEIIDP